MESKKIIVNQIRTPDGTRLCSRHRHDYVTYTDKNGLEYMVDGGTDYLRRTVHEDHPYEELSLYVGDSFERIREFFERGGRGKDGTKPLTWVPLKDMSDKWLLNTIAYVLKHSYNVDYDRIHIWTELPDNAFKSHRYLMPILIKHEMKKEGVESYTLSEIYIKELEYRIQHDIYIPDEDEVDAEPERWSLWRTLLNLVGL